MSSISGNFYPEIMVWMVDHANDPERQEDVRWIQQELTAADPLIHTAYPLCSKYFLQLRGLPIRTISRAVATKLTPDQRYAFEALHARFIGWCDRLGIHPLDMRQII
jgi:4-hydroxy-tetrahydrodipicolinate synthase